MIYAARVKLFICLTMRPQHNSDTDDGHQHNISRSLREVKYIFLPCITRRSYSATHLQRHEAINQT
ncbi:MAG: hypothetical protein DBW91_02400 [Candidatus Thioglobus sp.]|nr:MAG: hypothetical protein DBW91_02400 [Candidatus Thioglobus sp.]